MADENRGYEGRVMMGSTPAELTILKDLTTPLSRDELEDTIRGNNGVKTWEVGPLDYAVSGTVANQPDDARFGELKDSFFNGTTIANVDVEDQRDSSNAHSLLCTLMKVTVWTPGKPMDGEQTWDFTMRPARNGTTVPTVTFVEP